MRFALLAVALFSLVGFSSAQDPVNWNYTYKKIGDKTYEIHLKATVQSPWHIYSQFTPEGGPIPTKITFSKNPLVNLSERVKEEGKLLQKHEEVFGIDVKYFEGTIDFVQTVKMKSNVKTKVSGTIGYMVCNDQQCLPPKTIPFSIKLE